MTAGTDDTSVIALSERDVFVGWGDWRPGNVAGYFSAVKLQAFNHPAGDTAVGDLERGSDDQCHGDSDSRD